MKPGSWDRPGSPDVGLPALRIRSRFHENSSRRDNKPVVTWFEAR